MYRSARTYQSAARSLRATPAGISHLLEPLENLLHDFASTDFIFGYMHSVSARTFVDEDKNVTKKNIFKKKIDCGKSFLTHISFLYLSFFLCQSISLPIN